MPKQENVDRVARLKKEVGQASALYFLDFTKIGVNEFNVLRRRLKEAGATVRVVKNRLVKRALDESGIGGDVTGFLRGPTSLVLAVEDAVAPARVIREVGKKLETLKVKGAYVDGAVYSADQFIFLASLPTKDDLRGQVVGALAAPIWEFTLGLEGLISDLVYVLGQITDRKGDARAGS